MAVTADLPLEVWWFGEPAEKGGPHGLFGGSVNIIGDVSGGTSQIDVTMDIPQLQGKLLLFRHVVASTSAVTARAYTLHLVQNYLTPATTMPIAAGPSVVGQTDTAIPLVLPGAALLVKPSQNVSNTTILFTEVVNTDSEQNRLFVSGEIWEESRLRKANHGPLIRW